MGTTKASHLILTIFVVIVILLSCSGEVNDPQVNVSAQLIWQSPDLEYVLPEEVGWSSEKLEEARIFSQQIGAAAVMALYDGKVFIAWGKIATKYACHSIRNPFLNALFGIHVEKGNISLESTLEELNIDDSPPSLTSEELQAKVSNLLKSRSGVYHEAAAESQSMVDARPDRGSHPPGTFFLL